MGIIFIMNKKLKNSIWEIKHEISDKIKSALIN